MPFPFQIIDLTHTLSPETPSWNGNCGFSHEIKLDYKDNPSEVKFRVQQIKMHAGIGTHIDAPAHCIPNGKSVEDLSLMDLIVPCVVIDVSDRTTERYSLSVADIDCFETQHRPIAPKTFVIIRTGWDQYWNNAEKYRNNHIFPSVSKEAAEHLVKLDIAGLGIDTLSPDRSEDGFPTHNLILGAGKYIVENIANANQLPPIGAYSAALPIKTQGGTEAPIRLLGFISEKILKKKQVQVNNSTSP